MSKRFIITFEDEDDARAFQNYRAKAIETGSTVTGLTAGLASSAVKRAKITDAEEMIAVFYRLYVALDHLLFAVNHGNGLDAWWDMKKKSRQAIDEAKEIAKIIKRIEP